MMRKQLTLLACMLVYASAVPTARRIPLRRVARQFNPQQFLSPNFAVAARGGQQPQPQGQQQLEAPESDNDSDSDTTDNNSTTTTTSATDNSSNNSQKPFQPQRSGAMFGFGGQMSSGSNSGSQFDLFNPLQFFMPSQDQNQNQNKNQNQNNMFSLFNSFAGSPSSSGGSSPYFAVGLAPFSNLISPRQFINPRDRVDDKPENSTSSGSSGGQDFTGSASGGPDPSGPVGLTGDSGSGQIFQPPGFFINPGTSL